MIPPKYNFYIGSDFSINITYGTTINDSGQFISGPGKYASELNSIASEKPFIFFNLISTSAYNAIFFYDSSKSFISYKRLQSLHNAVIIPPSNAKYWSVRFTNADANFESKKDTKFVYALNAITPHYKGLSKKYAKESGQEFFRVSLDGKINLFGKDYEIIANSNLEDSLIFIIEKYNKKLDKYLEYYKGEFSKTDCKLNYSKKKCEIKITSIDEYSEIMDKYDNTYDLIKLAPEITKINLHKRSLMQVYVRGANSITNFFGGTYWEDDVNEAIDSHDDLVNKYYFAYIKAGNEFYVKDAGIEAVNGVYAGTNGYWSQWNGYTCYTGTNSPNVRAYIYIKRNSDNTILYKSEKQWFFTQKDNFYLNREDIVMVNVNDSSDKFTIKNPFVYHVYRRLLCDVDTVEDSDGVKNTYDLPINDFVTDNRNYKKCIGLGGGTFFCTSRAVNEPTKYGLNDYGQYFTNQFIPTTSGLGRPLPISKNSWANSSLWYVYDSYYERYEEKLRKQYTLKNSYSIGAAIKAILKKIDPTISHEPTAEYSQFLYGNDNPLGLARFYVYITQKTNILKGNYDQPAQKAETSLEELMKMLRDCFRCYWYIEDNKFKIEHIYFFMNGGSYSNQLNYQLDFTKLTDLFNKRLSSFFQSEIEFEKSDLSQRYEFAWMDDVTDLFGGVTIDVKSNYIQKGKTEEINIGQFSSDVDYMLFNPSNFSDDGFALLCPVKSGSTLELPIITVNNLIDENGDTYEAVVQNWYASWIYLQNFYMWDMPASNVESNVIGNIYTRAVKKYMKHTIEFPSEEDLDELELIKTVFGNGKIDEMSFNINTRHAKVNLLYEPQ